MKAARRFWLCYRFPSPSLLAFIVSSKFYVLYRAETKNTYYIFFHAELQKQEMALFWFGCLSGAHSIHYHCALYHIRYYLPYYKRPDTTLAVDGYGFTRIMHEIYIQLGVSLGLFHWQGRNVNLLKYDNIATLVQTPLKQHAYLSDALSRRGVHIAVIYPNGIYNQGQNLVDWQIHENFIKWCPASIIKWVWRS